MSDDLPSGPEGATTCPCKGAFGGCDRCFLLGQGRAVPTLDDLAGQVVAWQAVTFPTVTAAASVEHLQREARELAADPTDAEEAADVFLMLLSAVERAGIGLDGFRRAVADKLAKNKARVWKAPDACGVVEHHTHGGDGV